MTPEQQKESLFFPLLCVFFSAVLAVGCALSGLGTRWGWWDFRTGLLILKWTAYGECAIAILSLFGCFLPLSREAGRRALFVMALVISLIVATGPVRMALTARSLPMIHDITTDTENPPVFKAVLSARKDVLNPVEYGGTEIAQQQQKAYPDIVPLLLGIPPEMAFEHALAAAERLRWGIVSAEREQGIIEATDTTFWFGFKDDIVIRITPEGTGSRVDVRSLSRVGKSDVGTNANRIRGFFKKIKEQ
jgi:uncharacterized protein (DUF1499 family)